MTPLPRWLDEAGPRDPALRDALRDARRAPTEAQVAALAARVAERAAVRKTQAEPQLQRAKGQRWLRSGVWSLFGGALLAALWWSTVEPDVTAHVSPKPPAQAPAPAPVASQEVKSPKAEAPAIHVQPAQPSVSPRVLPKRKRTAKPTDDREPDAAQEDELALLQSASRLLLAQPARALALTQRHQRQFGASMFEEEREAVAIEALWRLGKHADAVARRRGFDERFPLSTYRSRLNSVETRSEPGD